MSSDEYSSADVDSIIAAARSALNDSNTLPLGFADTEILQRLLDILPTYLGSQSDAQYVVGELRNSLYSSVNTPSAANIHRVCASCSKCPSAATSASTPLWNIADPDLLIVVENPFIIKNQTMLDVLVAALKASGFSSTRICCTYATRCTFPGQIGIDSYANCVSYLYHEIHALRPKLVITFGAPVYAIITQTSPKSLKDIVGQISWLGSFPIMPLLSLAYMVKAISKIEDVQSSLETHFKTAYNFCYGDKN